MEEASRRRESATMWQPATERLQVRGAAHSRSDTHSGPAGSSHRSSCAPGARVLPVTLRGSRRAPFWPLTQLELQPPATTPTLSVRGTDQGDRGTGGPTHTSVHQETIPHARATQESFHIQRVFLPGKFHVEESGLALGSNALGPGNPTCCF